MNEQRDIPIDDLKAFQMLTEMVDDQPLSQRELASRLGIALGLVNSYIKNFVAKGFIRVKNFPSNRYAYLLTPQGLAEKSRLAYQHFSYFTSLYTVARQDYRELFHRLEASGVREVAFCGVDEVAEVAYLSLQETGLALKIVMDNELHEDSFFGLPVVSLTQGVQELHVPVVITSLKRRTELAQELDSLGVAGGRVFVAGVH
ncbi:MAG TPA: winged helix-turn-helix transcriptional regulator [Desulfuromonadales bacterium]|nr:winged helix-turn-helix transcriptional regulator [Desulfuromonadales bacterium]